MSSGQHKLAGFLADGLVDGHLCLAVELGDALEGSGDGCEELVEVELPFWEVLGLARRFFLKDEAGPDFVHCLLCLLGEGQGVERVSAVLRVDVACDFEER